MIATNPGLVVDASVAIPLFINEALTAKAEELFASLQQDPSCQISVPDLFYVECTNVLVKHAARGTYDPKDAAEDIGYLGQLRLGVFSTRELAAESFAIAERFEISAYDACYVALAVQLGVPLVTADRKLGKKVPAKMCEIRVLS
jgi:predicted nucleic acid-binding protein